MYAYVGGNPMSYIDPTGLFTENYFSRILSPERQGALAAAFTLIGGSLVNFGIGASGTVLRLPVGVPTFGLGGFFLYEGGMNGYTALKRLHNNAINSFDNQASIMVIPLSNILNQHNSNGRPQCPANN